MIIGYARVSSTSQNLERQILMLESYGCEKIFVEKESAKDFKRPVYMELKKKLRFGDVLVVTDLSRFGRNAEEINKEWDELVNQDIDIVILDMPILDTTKYKELDGVGKLITNIVKDLLSWMVEEERKRIRNAQKQGIKLAKEQGKYKGRPLKYHRNAKGQAKIIYDTIIRFRLEGCTIKGIERLTNVSRNTIKRILRDERLL